MSGAINQTAIKTYAGDRTIDGIVVTVDGEALDPRESTRRFARHGFEWSYEGPEPTQLAFAILADHLGDTDAAASRAERFMRAIVANFGNEWAMTSAEIDLALAALESTR